MSVEYIFSIAGVFTVAHICTYVYIYMLYILLYHSMQDPSHPRKAHLGILEPPEHARGPDLAQQRAGPGLPGLPGVHSHGGSPIAG